MPKPGPSATGKHLTTREAGIEFAGLITSPDESHETPDEQPQTGTPPVPDASAPAPSPAEPAATAEAPTEEPAPETYEVIVDGETSRVDLEELRAGYQKHEDYKRKTMALADERRAFEADAQAVQAERAQYAASLQQLTQALEQLQGEPDWVKLRSELEPAEFLKQKADWEASRAQTERLKQEQARVQEQQQREAAKQFQAYVRSEQDKLKAAVPEWADPEKAKVEAAKLRAHAKTYGFTDQEIDGVTDHRTLLLLRDAMQYRELQRAPSAKTQAKVAPIRTAKPGTAPPPPPPNAQLDKLVEQAAKTGRVRDAAAAIEVMLTERE